MQPTNRQLPPTSGDTRAQSPCNVDLWCFFHESATLEELHSAYVALLAPDERKRYERLHFPADRCLFLATRALARSVLAGYAAVRPNELHFGLGTHGKPELREPAASRDLRFNLSNTRGLAVLAVSSDCVQLGVDAELVRRDVNVEGLVRSFTDREQRALQALPLRLRARRLLEYWTLKESYLKARGLGLSVEPNQVEFRADRRGAIRVDLATCLEDDPSTWHFSMVPISDQHVVAIGARTNGAPLALRLKTYVPPAATDH